MATYTKGEARDSGPRTPRRCCQRRHPHRHVRLQAAQRTGDSPRRRDLHHPWIHRDPRRVRGRDEHRGVRAIGGDDGRPGSRPVDHHPPRRVQQSRREPRCRRPGRVSGRRTRTPRLPPILPPLLARRCLRLHQSDLRRHEPGRDAVPDPTGGSLGSTPPTYRCRFCAASSTTAERRGDQGRGWQPQHHGPHRGP